MSDLEFPLRVNGWHKSASEVRKNNKKEKDMSDKSNSTSEAEIVASLVNRLAESMKPVCRLMDEARHAGLVITWQGLGVGQNGRTVMSGLCVSKLLYPTE